MRNRFLAESQAGTHVVDVVQDTDTLALDDWISRGLLADYTIANDTDFAETAKHSGYWYPLRYAMIGVAWNTDAVPPEDAAVLSTWQGLADPRWQNYRTGVVDSGGSFALTPIYVWHEELGEEGIEKIGATDPQIFPSASNAAASLASGDIDVLLTASETGLLPLWLAGAPIQWALPSPAVGPISAQAVSANAPHPNAARLYQEYSFTDEGYGIWQALGGASASEGGEDMRDVAGEDWYHLPDSIFPVTAVNIEDLLATGQRMLDTYIKQ
jgi:iron(III) transport system substrate-binding protein